MEVLGVIPARFASSRFEGKVLADIHGKSMLQWVYERAKQARILDDLIIACDDERVEQAAKKFGAKVVFTSKDHLSGTDRIAEVANPIEAKVVVNIQADEPMVDPAMIEAVAQALKDDQNILMSSLRKEISDINQLHNPDVVKVVVDKDGFALYFSRSPLPSPEREIQKHQIPTQIESEQNENSRLDEITSPISQLPPVTEHLRSIEDNSTITVPKGFYKHIGLYAYTKDFLFTFKNLPVLHLERIERLEQLRALEYGYKIKVIETDIETIGVDTREDLEIVKERLPKT